MTCSDVAAAVHSQQKQHAHNVTPSGVEVVLNGQLRAGSATGHVWDLAIAASSHLVLAVLLAMEAWTLPQEHLTIDLACVDSAERPDLFVSSECIACA